MDVRRWSGLLASRTIWTHPTPMQEFHRMSTPSWALLGVLLVLLAIPLAFSFAPFVIGVIVLVVAARRGHRELSIGGTATA